MLFRRPDRRDEFDREALPWLDEIYRTAAGLLGSREHAGDLTQDVYLNAWKSYDRFEPGTNIRAWLHKILVHRAAHFRRKLYRETPFGNKDEETQDIPEEVSVPDHFSDRQVMDALGRLTAPYREVILLSDVREFAYKEIAEMLEVPIGTVMSRLSRARKQLRDELNQVAKERGLA